ncbi:MAG: hypothetical protein N2204_06390 [Anaerolineae bacterium]|nr:hypothetical protein [Anaerolineae bacterium]
MDTLLTWLDFRAPITWLASSVAAAVILTNLVWPLRRLTGHFQASGWHIGAWLGKALFFVLLPLAAWQQGVLSPFYLGIAGLDWVPALLLGAPVTLAITAVTLAGWQAYRRSLAGPTQLRAGNRLITLLRAPVEAGLLQWHWAFYRALAIAGVAAWPASALQTDGLLALDFAADALYWGSWVGLLILGLEWLLNPFARLALRLPGDRETSLRQAAFAVATTGLFVATRNLWLCLACHVMVEIVIAAWLPLASEQSP